MKPSKKILPLITCVLIIAVITAQAASLNAASVNAASGILFSAAAGGSDSSPGGSYVNPFSDVSESDWFFDAVGYVHQYGLVSGTSETTFSPEEAISRGMMVTILWNHIGKPQVKYASFIDVPADAWYAGAVNWAEASGVARGIGLNYFLPEEKITREQMAVMLYNYARLTGVALPALREGVFSDADEISPWAEEAVNALYASQIINGRLVNDFNPQGESTRAEAVTMIMNFLNLSIR
jgi:hypothetical protein